MAKNKVKVIITVVCVVGIALVSWSMADTLAKGDYNALGLAAYEEGNYDKAIEYHTKAIQSDTRNALGYHNRGLTYYRMGTWWESREPFHEAISDFTKAIELDAEFVDAYYNRGLARCRLFHFYSKSFPEEPWWGKDFDQYRKALADFDRVFELDSMYVLAHIGKGLAYYHNGQLDEAVEEYTKALGSEDLVLEKAGEKGLAEAYAGRGRVYREQKEFDKSVLDYGKALELNPKWAWALRPQAANYAALGQVDKSLEHWNRLIDLIETDPEFVDEFAFFEYLSRGMLYYRMQEYSKAILDFDKLIGFKTDFMMMGKNFYVEAHKFVGLIYSQTGDSERAREYLEKALELAQDRGLDKTAQAVEELLNEL